MRSNRLNMTTRAGAALSVVSDRDWREQQGWNSVTIQLETAALSSHDGIAIHQRHQAATGGQALQQ